ncbi:hypothetical protein SARC_05813 [Sphaeroforma arctica JP610]|uniref:AP-3 complex subunit delta n=1 Tax=Sphaeroforma arctica JP610 TaxID=667725 RepID=A0A0L0FYF6_9EUKA|nr:hypothetical protein SARC_05813 [Sphaeroforma arctica JP610]KNC81882.1 hypothetical protein SARC_05813 [Sphaeroforma arctica JP610]|eukprot:XP_014155784.1 hypothetical protein SARC_05813 [Sphaeroforma arctica JP610]
MFTKDLQDLIRGLRQNKGTEAKYIADCLNDISLELKTDSNSVKTKAISKLTYLHMLGYDTSFAAFKTVEIMSQSKFSYKRVGYLMASQTFRDDTDVLMLTTNLIKKDMMSPNQYEAGLALTALSVFVTADLARDLANDVITLFSSSRPYIRKKAILAMYKVFLKFPDSLRPAFPRLRERLEDPDLSVQCAAVNVICELARKNPKSYLSLAPTLYKLLSASNNWMLIKIIKLFAALMPLEPRLSKKLAEPLSNILHTTNAMSLLYETISAVIAGMPDHTPMLQLCVTKLRTFVEDSDQNLKFLGLVQLSKVSEIQPRLVMDLKDVVMVCLDDEDETIRMRTMGLLVNMVSKKSLPDIVKKILATLGNMGPRNRDALIEKMIDMCSQENYKYIEDFEWYLTVILSLVTVEHSTAGELVSHQILDVCVRVKEVRAYAVNLLSPVVQAPFEGYGASPPLAKEGNMVEVMYAAVWVISEYSEHLMSPKDAIRWLLQPQVGLLSPAVQAICVHNALKIFACAVLPQSNSDRESMESEFIDEMLKRLPMFEVHSDMEVQERACSVRETLKLYRELCLSSSLEADDENGLDSFLGDTGSSNANGMSLLNSGDSPPDAPPLANIERTVDIDDMGTAISDTLALSPKASDSSSNADRSKGQNVTSLTVNEVNIQRASVESQRQAAQLLLFLFEGDLNPIAATAQAKVPIPENINLEKWIHTKPSSSEEESSSDDNYDNANNATSYNSYGNDGRSNSYRGGGGGDISGGYNQGAAHGYGARPAEDPAEVARRLEARRVQNQSNPHYLGGSGNTANESSGLRSMSPIEVDSIPIAKLDLGQAFDLGVGDGELSRGEHKHRGKRGKRSKRDRRHSGVHEASPPRRSKNYTIQQVEDFPTDNKSQAANSSKSRRKADRSTPDLDKDDPHAQLGIDLDMPLTEKDAIPVQTHRTASSTPTPTSGSNRHKSDRERDEEAAAYIAAKEDKTNKHDSDKRRTDKKHKSGSSRGHRKSKYSHSHAKGDASNGEGNSERDVGSSRGASTDERSYADGERESRKKKKKSKDEARPHKDNHSRRKTGDSEESSPRPIVSFGDDNGQGSGYDLGAMTTLVTTDNSSVQCAVGYSGDGEHDSTVFITFVVTNLSSEVLENVEFDVNSNNDSLKQQSTSSIANSIKTSSSAQLRHTYVVSLPLQAVTLEGTLRYSTASHADWMELPFTYELPVSAYVVPVACTPNELSVILSAYESPLASAAPCEVKVAGGLKVVMDRIVAAGHLAIVELSDSNCSAYGRAVTGHHVCVLATQLIGDDVRLSCKASSTEDLQPTIATLILEDLKFILE